MMRRKKPDKIKSKNKTKSKHPDIKSLSKLAESNFRIAFNNAVDAIFWADAETGSIINCNKAAERLLEKKKKDIIGVPQISLHPPLKKKYYHEMFKKHVAEKRAMDVEAEVITKSGALKPVRITASVTLVDDRKIIQGIFRDISEQKEAAETLRENEKFLESIFNGIQDGISILDSKLNIVRVNEWMEKMYAARIPLVGKKCYEAYHGRKTVCPWCPSVKTLKDGKTHIGVVPYTVEGEIKGWILLSAYPLKDAKGKVVGVIEDVKDITEQRNAQESLRESEEKLRSLVKSAPNTIFISDREGKIQFINRTTPGLVVKDVIGRSMYEFIQPQYHDLVKKKINRVFRTGETVSYEIEGLGAHGNIRWYMSNVGPIKLGNKVVSAITISTDITESKEAEAALRSSEERYRMTLESMVDPIHVIDSNLRVVLFNNAFKEWCKQLGLGTKVIGKNIFEAFPFLPARVRDEMKRVFSSGEVLHTEETHEIGGTQVITEVYKIPVFEEGKVIRVITVVRDVTESRRTERMRENLIRDMSHSLKTPVAMLEMAHDIGQRGIKVNDMERIKKAMHLAENNVTRLRKDVNNILEVYVLSRTKQEKLRKHSSVRKVLKEVIKNTKYILEDKNLSLKIDIQAGADRVLVIERELYTLLSNIIDNAVKFTEKGRISLSVRPKAKLVQIKVKDTGDGMTPDQRGMIFERFYKRSAATPGMGLGLTISKEIVDKCGGKIKITSKGPGKGTAVAIDLPKE